MQTWFDFDQDIVGAMKINWPVQRDRLRSCVRAGGGHFEHSCDMNVHLHDS